MHDSSSLFADSQTPSTEQLGEGIFLLRSFATKEARTLLEEIRHIDEATPFRHLVVRGGHTMSVAMTNVGSYGWVSDEAGYRYTTDDPLSQRRWLPLPESFSSLATRAAAEAGFAPEEPNACLINRYAVGARLSLHQDKDELDFEHPIVSVSLGIPATFLLGTLHRSDTPRRIRVEHGDVLVWGGPSRLIYHGVAPIRLATHPLTGPYRINLTFRHVAQP